jgi:integrase
MKLTETIVRAATLEKYGRDELPDDKVPGLILRLRKSGTKTYIVRASINGERKSKTLGSPDKGMTLTDARERAQKELVNGLAREEKPEAAPTLTDMMETWEKSDQPNHKKQYVSDFRRHWRKHIAPTFGDVDIRTIDKTDVREWFYSLEADGVSKVSANRIHSTIQKLFTLAIETKHINFNPAAGLKKHVEDPRERVFTIEEINLVLDALHAEESASPIGSNILRCGLMISARISEILNMKHAHFDFNRMVWQVPPSMRKTKNAITAPLTPHFASFIRSRPQWSDTYVFPSPKNPEAPARYEIARDVWHKVRPDTDAKIHDFRRTIATSALSAGMNVIGIQSMLGHKNFSTTAKSYLHPASQEAEIMTAYHEQFMAGIFGPGDEA